MERIAPYQSLFGFRTQVIVLSALALAFAFCKTWHPETDLWETLATIRAVADNPIHPKNPMLDLPGETSPRFTPYTVLWGSFMRVFKLDAFTVVGAASLANLLLFLFGLRKLILSAFKDSRLPAVLLPVMLLAWGTGYNEANGYNLTFFLDTLALTSVFTYGISFFGLASFIRFCTKPSGLSALLFLSLFTIAFLTHPITAAFFAVTAGCYALVTTSLRDIVILFSALALSMLFALQWPYFSQWTMLTKGTTEAWYDRPLFINPILPSGISLLGLPILAYFWTKRRNLFPVIAALACIVLYSVTYALNIFIGSRFILFAIFFLHVAIGLMILELYDSRKKILASYGWKSIAACGLVILLLLPTGYFRAREVWWYVDRFYDPPLTFHAYDSPTRPLQIIANSLDTFDVVMAVDSTAWTLPALSGARVVAQLKGNPLIPEEIAERQNIAADFHYREMSSEMRLKTIQDYSITHILVNRDRAPLWSTSLKEFLATQTVPVALQDSLQLYEIRPNNKSNSHS